MMKNSDPFKDILGHSEYFLDKIEKELEAGPSIRKNQAERPADNVYRFYNRIHILSSIISNDYLKNNLKNLIHTTYQISKNDYSVNGQIEWLNKLSSTVASAKNVLTPQVCQKIRDITKKEVAFIELNSVNIDLIKKIKLIEGGIYNITHLDSPSTTQQIYINVLVNESINFRLLTLSSEQAWDFIAQSLIEYTKTKPV